MRSKEWELSKSVVLYAAHFKDDDFMYDRSLFAQILLKLKRMLNPDEVSSIFSHCKPYSGKLRPVYGEAPPTRGIRIRQL